MRPKWILVIALAALALGTVPADAAKLRTVAPSGVVPQTFTAFGYHRPAR